MPTWKTDTNVIKNQSNEMKNLASKLSRIGGSIRSTGSLNGIHFEGQAAMEFRIRELCDNVETEASRVRNLGSQLAVIAQIYEANENGIKNNSSSISRIKNTPSGGGAGAGASGAALPGAGGGESGPSGEDDVADLFFERLKAYLKLDSKINGDTNSSILNEGWGYLENLLGFFSGDKRGWTGAADLCDLTKSSSDLWTALYNAVEKADKAGYYKSNWGKKVAFLGLFGSSVGFLGKIAEAVSSDNSTALKRFANILDAGSGAIDVGKSSYEAVNFAKLADLKQGLLSTAGKWAALGETTTTTFAQMLRSIDEYYADGNWSLGDTGATGIDMSIAGLEKLISCVTFGAISEDTIGMTTEEMSDAVKEKAENIGTGAGNYILQDKELLEEYQNGNGFDKARITAYAVVANWLGW